MSKQSQNPEELPLRERPISEISGVLQGVLGQRLVAYAIAERDPKKIGALARAEVEPTEEVAATLRDLAEVTETGLEIDGSEEIVRATMIGMNPSLNDQAPIEMFHNGEGHRVAAVARSVFDQ
jgi:hypothetical protein